MSLTVSIIVSPEDRARLTTIMGIAIGRGMPKHRDQGFIKFRNAVVDFCSIITRKRLSRGVFTPVPSPRTNQAVHHRPCG